MIPWLTKLIHGRCIQGSIDLHNKMTRQQQEEVFALQETIAALQRENMALHKEILFTQVGCEREKENDGKP